MAMDIMLIIVRMFDDAGERSAPRAVCACENFMGVY